MISLLSLKIALMAKPKKQVWIGEVSPSDIRKMIDRTFSFLVSDYSFRKPTDISINTLMIGYSYSGHNLAIEPVVDRKDGFVETGIVRLNRGIRPKGWEIDDKGEQFKTRLFVAAWDRKLMRTAPVHLPESPEDMLQSLLDAEVATLRDGFPDFLADDAGYFVELNQRRKAATAIKAGKDFFAKAEKLFQAKDFSALLAHMGTNCPPLSKLWEARLTYARKNA